MRELREFRALHGSFESEGIGVAAIVSTGMAQNRRWVRRLSLPYPVLADAERRAAEALGVLRRIGVAGWNLEFFARATFLADARGVICAVWEKCEIKGHAEEVLATARALRSGS